MKRQHWIYTPLGLKRKICYEYNVIKVENELSLRQKSETYKIIKSTAGIHILEVLG